MTSADTALQEAVSEEVIFEARGHMGIITLNRPTALNALNLHMIRLIDSHLIACAGDDNIKAVIIEGAGGRAFCSGGDVKTIAQSITRPEGAALARDFFREEYTLNHRIHTYPKPYISLIDGIVMGGGKGISAHGSHRIVTENTLFAMPETNIGFFPDVGGGYFLPRCPGQTGLYLAMTSKRIKAIDTVYIGFGTHFVPAAKIFALRDALCGLSFEREADIRKDIDRVIESFTEEVHGESELAPKRLLIDECFGADRVEDIFAALEKYDDAWATETLAALYSMSPTSLKVALRQIRTGKSLDFGKAMTMEYRLSQRLVHTHDFYEGIRAALIDKDRQPKWNPARLSEVTEEQIDAFFAPLDSQDLVLK